MKDRSERRRRSSAAAMLALLAATAFSGGCASWLGKSPDAKYVAEQQRWWEENKHRSQYVTGKGYYIEQVGYFDGQGKPIYPDDPAGGDEAKEKKSEGLSINDFSPGRLVDSTRHLVTGKPDRAIAQSMHDEAQELLRRQQYEEARDKFKSAASRWPDSPTEESALFYAAECEYFLQRFPAADDAYAALVKKYPNTRFLDQVSRRRFALAEEWLAMDRENPHWPITPNFWNNKRPLFDSTGRARRALQGVITSDAGSELADAAAMALADALFEKKRYEEADFRYQMVVADFPNSKYQYQAHQRSLSCKLLMYDGPEYDGTMLQDAKEMVDRMLVQFPEIGLEERTKLQKFRTEIAVKLADRDWHMAEYYVKGGHYRAARKYYQKLAHDYPNTPHAERALARLEEYRDKPAEPTDPVQWAKRLFGADGGETQLR